MLSKHMRRMSNVFQTALRSMDLEDISVKNLFRNLSLHDLERGKEKNGRTTFAKHKLETQTRVFYYSPPT